MSLFYLLPFAAQAIPSFSSKNAVLAALPANYILAILVRSTGKYRCSVAFIGLGKALQMLKMKMLNEDQRGQIQTLCEYEVYRLISSSSCLIS